MRGRPETPEVERFLSKVAITNGCFIWLGSTDRGGYGQFRLSRANGFKMVKSHQYAYRLFKGFISEGLDVMHSCDNAGCPNPEHLSTGTALQNNRDKWARGRGTRLTGSKNPMFGKPAWNRDRKWPKKVRIKISESNKGKSAWNKGIPGKPGWTANSAIKQSISMKGNTNARKRTV